VASKIKHELCVVVEKYTDREGKEKNRWQKVGVELETDTGGRIILLERWFNPAGVMNPDGRTTVMLSLFDPKDSTGAPAKPASSSGVPPESAFKEEPADAEPVF
jgi:hypothetical protein